MHEITRNKSSLIQTLSTLNIEEPRPASGHRPPAPGVLYRVGASIPRAWLPIAMRGLSGITTRLPDGLRNRLRRMVGILRPDMGTIERDYPAWIDRFDRIDAQAHHAIGARIARMADPPLISVVLPVYNPPPDHLMTAIRSVRDQIYPGWELCIADDASTDPAVIDVLKDAVAADRRIKLVRRESNGHISAASNSALRLASGLFVALLDHDDILPPHALYEVASRIAAQPDVDILYSDEDHIDHEGRRSHPYFKPGWNPELMLGQNLISHFGIYRRSLIEKIGGFRLGLEGSQDHDLALRAVAETAYDRIAHIPKILYHWRQGASDRTFSESARDRCVASGRKAIEAFLARQQPGATTAPAPFVPGWTRVVYPIPSPRPLVSVIVSGDNPTEVLLRCIDGLLNRTNYAPLEVLIAGRSDVPTMSSSLINDERVRLLTPRNSPLNSAAEAAAGSLLLFLDPALAAGDPHWIAELVSHAVRADVGAVGAKLLCPEGTVSHAGLVLGGADVVFRPFVGSQHTQAGYFGHLQLTRAVSAVSGGCLMVRRQAFLDAAGFDENGLPPELADVGLCLTLTQSGLRHVWTPHAQLWSQREPAESATDSIEFRRAAGRMQKKWGARVASDPYWNPNLTPNPAETALAFPPLDQPTPERQAA